MVLQIFRALNQDLGALYKAEQLCTKQVLT